MRPPLEELVRHNRLVTHHRFLAAQQQRQDITHRLRVRQDNKLRIARARAEFSAMEAPGQDLRGLGLATEPAGQAIAIAQAASAGAGQGRAGRASARPDRGRQAASGLSEGENLRGELRCDHARSDADGGEGGGFQQAHRRDRVTRVETAHAIADLCFSLAERAGPISGRLARGQPEMGNLMANTYKAKAEHQMTPDQAGQAEQPVLTSLAPGGKASADGGARACEFGCGFSSVSQRVSA